LAAVPDVEAVKRVVGDRNPDPEQLQRKDKREPAQEGNLPRVSAGAVGREGIRDKMLNQEQPDRNNAAERVQATPEKRMTLAGTQRSDTTLDDRGSSVCSSCQQSPLRNQQ